MHWIGVARTWSPFREIWDSVEQPHVIEQQAVKVVIDQVKALHPEFDHERKQIFQVMLLPLIEVVMSAITYTQQLISTVRHVQEITKHWMTSKIQCLSSDLEKDVLFRFECICDRADLGSVELKMGDYINNVMALFKRCLCQTATLKQTWCEKIKVAPMSIQPIDTVIIEISREITCFLQQISKLYSHVQETEIELRSLRLQFPIN